MADKNGTSLQSLESNKVKLSSDVLLCICFSNFNIVILACNHNFAIYNHTCIHYILGQSGLWSVKHDDFDLVKNW